MELIAQGRAPRTPQQEEEATYAPMLTKELAAIDFMKPAAQVHNLVRGMNPWPVAHTLLEGQPLKVYAARLSEGFQAKPERVYNEVLAALLDKEDSKDE